MVDAIDTGINNNSIKDAVNGSNGTLITAQNPTSDQIVAGINAGKNNMKVIVGQALSLVLPSVTIPANPSIDFSEYISKLFNAMGLNGMDIFTSSGNWVCPTGITQVLVILLHSGAAGNSGDGKETDGGPISGRAGYNSRAGYNKGGTGGKGGPVYYMQNLTVVPGRSYPIIVGAEGTTISTNNSTFNGQSGTYLSNGGNGGDGGYFYGYMRNPPSYGETSYNGKFAATDFQRNFQIGEYSFSAILAPGGKGGDAIYNYYEYGEGSSTPDVSKDTIFVGGAKGRFTFPNLKNNPGEGGNGANSKFVTTSPSWGTGYVDNNSGKTNGKSGAVIVVYNKKI